MFNLLMFDTEEELKELTGIKEHEDLWANGFDLDDWDVGFCCDEPLDSEYVPDYPDEYEEPERVGEDGACWLINRMAGWCAGYRYTEYNDKFYYMVYHS